jgi:hypothetical protein
VKPSGAVLIGGMCAVAFAVVVIASVPFVPGGLLPVRETAP